MVLRGPEFKSRSGPFLPFGFLFSSGKIELVDILLKKHVNPRAVDALGYTALHLAVQVGSARSVEKLSQASGDPLRLSADSGHKLPQTV